MRKLNKHMAQICREATQKISDGEWGEGPPDAPVKLVFAETGLPMEAFQGFAIGWTLRGYVAEVDQLFRECGR